MWWWCDTGRRKERKVKKRTQNKILMHGLVFLLYEKKAKVEKLLWKPWCGEREEFYFHLNKTTTTVVLVKYLTARSFFFKYLPAFLLFASRIFWWSKVDFTVCISYYYSRNVWNWRETEAAFLFSKIDVDNDDLLLTWRKKKVGVHLLVVLMMYVGEIYTCYYCETCDF